MTTHCVAMDTYASEMPGNKTVVAIFTKST